MAKEVENQGIINMTDQQVFDELINLHAKAAGESLSSILKADIEISGPEITEITVKEVEYGILEPAIFVKSCLTSGAAGNMVIILRQRDMQAFLNELMGIDDLPDPDFEFDEVAMSAATELMNQMVHASVEVMAEYLGNTMESSDCQLILSDGRQNLSPSIGEAPESKTIVIHYRVKIKDMVESEFMECISTTAADCMYQEIEARREADKKAEAEAKAMEESLLVKPVQPGAVPASAGREHLQSAAEIRTVNSTAVDGGRTVFQASPPINGNLGLIMDVPLNVSVEIGKTRRRLKDVLNFNNGTVVELDKQADAPVDIIVNGQLIARGEVVVIDDNFGVRISEIVNTRSIIGNGE